MSTYQYARALVDGRYDIDAALRMSIVESIAGVDVKLSLVGDRAIVETVPDLDPAQKTTLDSVVAAHRGASPGRALIAAKAAKLFAIDGRTRELIAAGFEFEGKTFSASLEAQAKAANIHQLRNNPALAYPIEHNTIDDAEAPIEFVDAAHLEAWYLVGVGTIRAYIDSGTELKNLVRTAATVEDVNAVEDIR